MIDRSVKVDDRKMELTYIIADYLTNGYQMREERASESISTQNDEAGNYSESVSMNEGLENRKVSRADVEKVKEKVREEQILNQVIGEFLQ